MYGYGIQTSIKDDESHCHLQYLSKHKNTQHSKTIILI